MDYTEIKVKCGGLWEYLTVIRNDRGGGKRERRGIRMGSGGVEGGEKREGRGEKEKR